MIRSHVLRTRENFVSWIDKREVVKRRDDVVVIVLKKLLRRREFYSKLMV